MQVEELRTEIDDVEVHWRRAGDAPILYVHGVPTGSWDWLPLLERTGGIAPDLPGFGSSAKPAHFPYNPTGYDRFLEQFVDAAGLERFSLVVHDFGGRRDAVRSALPRADRTAGGVQLAAADVGLSLASRGTRSGARRWWASW